MAYYRVALGSSTMELLATAEGHAMGTRRPQVTADGNAIVYVDREAGPEWVAQRIVRFDLTTRTATELIGGLPNVTSFALSPDGTRIAYLHNATQEQQAAVVLFVKTIGGDDTRELTRHKDLGPARFSGLAWTADQRYVLYVKPSKIVSINPSERWKVPVSGGPAEPTGIAMSGLIRLPSVHPNGAQIAFAASGGGTAPAIWVAEGIAPARGATALK